MLTKANCAATFTVSCVCQRILFTCPVLCVIGVDMVINDILQLLLSGWLTCLSLNSLICASEASSCFLLLGLPEPGIAFRGGFSKDFRELVTDEVKPKGFGEVDGGRVE